jgi:tRNA(adenine34) deaminase
MTIGNLGKIPSFLPQERDPWQRHRAWMQLALEEARQAGEAGEVPVAALVVGPGEELLALSGNRRERDRDPTAHAEILALRQAGQRLGDWQLQGCRLYVTLEPCPMCAGAISQSRLAQVIYGADDPKAGALRSVLTCLLLLPASIAQKSSGGSARLSVVVYCRSGLAAGGGALCEEREPKKVPLQAVFDISS